MMRHLIVDLTEQDFTNHNFLQFRDPNSLYLLYTAKKAACQWLFHKGRGFHQLKREPRKRSIDDIIHLTRDGKIHPVSLNTS